MTACTRRWGGAKDINSTVHDSKNFKLGVPDPVLSSGQAGFRNWKVHTNSPSILCDIKQKRVQERNYPASVGYTPTQYQLLPSYEMDGFPVHYTLLARRKLSGLGKSSLVRISCFSEFSQFPRMAISWGKCGFNPLELDGTRGISLTLNVLFQEMVVPCCANAWNAGVDYLRSSASDVLLQRAAALTAEAFPWPSKSKPLIVLYILYPGFFCGLAWLATFTLNFWVLV